jgi:hypothetical protein
MTEVDQESNDGDRLTSTWRHVERWCLSGDRTIGRESTKRWAACWFFLAYSEWFLESLVAS